MADDAIQLHKLLRMQVYGGMVVLQPIKSREVAAQSLTCDLQTGNVALAQHDAMDKGFKEVFGVIGLARLLSGSVLAVITGAEQVATLRGWPVYCVTETELVGKGKLTHADDKKYAYLLMDALSPHGSGRGLYFSHGGDLTLTQQRWTSLGEDPAAAKKPQWARADARFFWNRRLTTALTEPGGLDAFVLPLILGSVGELKDLQLQAGEQAWLGSLTLLARRSTRRAGTRHWRRGADNEGAAANLVESEQLLVLRGSEDRQVVSSYVQVRGSIPLLWSQVPNIKYKPTTRIAPVEACQPAFDRHVRQLLEQYKEVTAVSLVNLHGSEGVLADAFRREAQRFAESTSGFRLVDFDFHKECAGSRYHNLSKLFDRIEQDWRRYGYFYQDSSASARERQQGIVRTNCIDCLDRTNVVQGVLARKQLEAVLARLKLLQPGIGGLPTAFPKVEARFKILWADHGDAISRQYAGTGALKSGFTRTGVRTKMGLLDDGVKSAARYYLNNFQDGRKQDALDLATGAFDIAQQRRGTPFTPQPSAFMPMLLALGLLTWGLGNLVSLLRGQSSRWEDDIPIAYGFAQLVAAPMLLGLLIVFAIFKAGKYVICKPQLCPELAQTWK